MKSSKSTDISDYSHAESQDVADSGKYQLGVYWTLKNWWFDFPNIYLKWILK